jgi:pectinesterase
MNFKRLIYLIFFILANCSSSVEPEKFTAYLVGDSTMADKKAEVYPETGWGQVLVQYLDNNVRVDNRALNGRSTKSFINENKWQPIVDQLKKGDYVLIEFGHNDEKIDKPETGTTLEEYQANLSKYVLDARAKKAVPILLTPIARRSFRAGKYFETHGQYPNAMINVAKKLDVPLIDMHSKSITLIKRMGDENSKKLYNWADSAQYAYYPNGIKDNTHLNEDGAQAMAALVIEGIKELNLPLKRAIKR